MSTEQDSTAVAVARAHVEAWGRQDYDAARARLAQDVHVTVTSVDPGAPNVETIGVEEYMHGLIEFGQIVLPDTTIIDSAVGDGSRALLRVSSRVKMGPGAPEMTLHAARAYRLGEDEKIADEQVIFFVAPQ